MRYAIPIITALLLATTATRAQQQNHIFSSLALNGDATAAYGQGPVGADTYTDSEIAVSVHGFPGTALILAAGQPAVGAVMAANSSIDFVPFPGMTFVESILVDGNVNPAAVTDATTGLYDLGVTVPSCFPNFFGTFVCPGALALGFQAVTMSPFNPPFGFGVTALGIANVQNGYTPFSLTGDQAIPYTFKDGMSFTFYGNTYTTVWVSANGYISFTQASTGFPNPTVAEIRAGTPRIMSFYNDLTPEVISFNPRIYAEHSVTPGGTRMVRFVHERISEFGNATGPHGGEIELAETGEITVTVHPYNAFPSINTGVGLAPGQNQGVAAGTYGRDLSADAFGGPTLTPPMGEAFELYDHGAVGFPFGPQNPIDIVGIPIQFAPDAAFTSYAIF